MNVVAAGIIGTKKGKTITVFLAVSWMKLLQHLRGFDTELFLGQMLQLCKCFVTAIVFPLMRFILLF